MRYPLLLILALLLPIAPLHAADDAATATATATETDDADTGTGLSEAEQAAAMAAEIAAAEAAAAAGASTGNAALTDENFVPSVQISEDLSVSFPVDI